MWSLLTVFFGGGARDWERRRSARRVGRGFARVLHSTIALLVSGRNPRWARLRRSVAPPSVAPAHTEPPKGQHPGPCQGCAMFLECLGRRSTLAFPPTVTETSSGVRRQLKDCEALAARKGWEVAERYVDDDVSAYSGRVRPEYQRMLGDLAAHVVDAVIVWDLDRLHRRPKELEEFFELCEAAGIRSLASVAGDVDLATHDGQFTARILGAVARKESDDKSRRIKRKVLELAQAGRDAGGGCAPLRL